MILGDGLRCGHRRGHARLCKIASLSPFKMGAWKPAAVAAAYRLSKSRQPPERISAAPTSRKQQTSERELVYANDCACSSVHWGYSAVSAAFSAAGVGLSTKLSSRPSSPRPAAIRNMVPQVAGTRYRSAGCPMCVMALAAKAMPRPPMYAACMHAA